MLLLLMDLLPTLLLTQCQALSVLDMTTALENSELSSPLLLTPCTGSAYLSSTPSGGDNMHTVTPASPAISRNFGTHTSSVSDNTDTDSSAYDPMPFITQRMSTYGTAKCVHAEPKRIPLLTSGEVSPMVMHQWEMVCEDFFSANKKLEEVDWVAAVLPGLKDMRTQDWVATHCSELTAVPFPSFMKQLCKEFLSDGWDDELHAHICNACLKPSDSFMKWVNDIRHLNIILRGMDYHFSEDTLCFQLDSLLDVDLRMHCKNCKIKNLVDAAANVASEKTGEARLSTWIAEVCKLAEECQHDTKHYLKASKDFQRAPKRQALANNSHALNAVPAKVHNTANSSAGTHTKPPHLTDNERSLLHKHQGCMKCRHGYQTHHASDCPFDFPDPHNYRELTEEILLGYKHGGASNNKTVGIVTSSS